jgi:hypothetical protein
MQLLCWIPGSVSHKLLSFFATLILKRMGFSLSTVIHSLLHLKSGGIFFLFSWEVLVVAGSIVTAAWAPTPVGAEVKAK